MTAGHSQWLKWITQKSKRDIVAFILSGLGLIGGAAWPIYTYWSKLAPIVGIQVTYHVCVGESKDNCPRDSIFLSNQGGESVSSWAKRECGSYTSDEVGKRASICNCYVVEVKCTSQ
jgi:hypothetical protein